MALMDNEKEGWSVEEIGIAQVPDEQCTATLLQLFWVWSAANIGILGVVYGAIIVSFQLSFVQAVLAGILGVASFALVGLTSFAGQRGRTSTLTLSRVIFGRRGNIAPTLFSWVNLMGWETVNIITGTLTLAALLQTLGLSSGLFTTAISLLCFASLVIGISMLGQNVVVTLQSWLSRIFGTMTLLVALYIFITTDWQLVWAIAGADYSRYQSAASDKGRIFTAVMLGASLPLLLLILTGILLSVHLPDLVSSSNPIALIGSVLPPWMAIPYLMAATAGIVTIAVLSLYSASLNLLTIGVNVKQVIAVPLNALLILALAIYVLFVSGDFLDTFITFLIFCGVFLASWEAIFIMDYLWLRCHQGYAADALYGEENRGVRVAPLACWLLGSLGGLLVSKTGFIDGPLATGIFADSSLGLFVAFLISWLSYTIYLLCRAK
ncbi:MAG: purine-cytosine permease family protein [Enterobacteriaceae bacterium]